MYLVSILNIHEDHENIVKMIKNAGGDWPLFFFLKLERKE